MLNLFILVYKKQKDFFQSFVNNLEIVAPGQPPRKSVRGRELVTPWKTCCNRFKSKPYLVLLVNGEHFSQLFHKYTIRLPFDMTSDKLRLQSWFLTYLLYRTNVRRNLSRMLLCRIILKCLLPWYSVLTFFRSCLANLERGRGLTEISIQTALHINKRQVWILFSLLKESCSISSHQSYFCASQF